MVVQTDIEGCSDISTRLCKLFIPSHTGIVANRYEVVTKAKFLQVNLRLFKSAREP